MRFLDGRTVHDKRTGKSHTEPGRDEESQPYSKAAAFQNVQAIREFAEMLLEQPDGATELEDVYSDPT